MASPIGHSLSGLSLYLLARQGGGGKAARVAEVLAVLLISSLPDLDLLPGLLYGDGALWHHRATHSLAFAAAVSVCIPVAGVLIKAPGRAVRRWSLLAGALLLLHVGLDLFTSDDVPPVGMQLWWPFSPAYVIAPWTFLDSVRRGPPSPELLRVWAAMAAREVLVFGGVLTAVLYGRRHGKIGNA